MDDVYFTADLHLQHRLVAGHRGFGEDVDAHDKTLAANWDRRVRDNDTVWVQGDLTMSKLDYSLDWIADRPGTKHFISGNHDGCHPMHRGWTKIYKRFAQVFETVGTLGSVRMQGEKVLLSHFPRGGMEGADRTVEPRYMEWRVRESDLWLLHGHTHMADQRVHGGRQIHVGLDAWDLQLVNQNQIMKLMREAG